MPVMSGVEAICRYLPEFPSAEIIVYPPIKKMKTSIARSRQENSVACYC